MKLELIQDTNPSVDQLFRLILVKESPDGSVEKLDTDNSVLTDNLNDLVKVGQQRNKKLRTGASAPNPYWEVEQVMEEWCLPGSVYKCTDLTIIELPFLEKDQSEDDKKDIQFLKSRGYICINRGKPDENGELCDWLTKWYHPTHYELHNPWGGNRAGDSCWDEDAWLAITPEAKAFCKLSE